MSKTSPLSINRTSMDHSDISRTKYKINHLLSLNYWYFDYLGYFLYKHEEWSMQLTTYWIKCSCKWVEDHNIVLLVAAKIWTIGSKITQKMIFVYKPNSDTCKPQFPCAYDLSLFCLVNDTFSRFCLFIDLWVLTFPLEDCSVFGNFAITLINKDSINWPSMTAYNRV